MFLRAAVEILPEWAPPLLGLEAWRLKAWERPLVRLIGRFMDAMVVEATPASAACRRLGLPSDYLQRHPL
jgi:uncharacterized protein (DUF2236 family)